MRISRLVAFLLLVVPGLVVAQQQHSVLFTNVMVWDGTSEALRKADVLVAGNKIAEVSDEPLAVIQSTDMTVIDGGGRTLMPGLIDSHVHLNMYKDGTLLDLQNSTWEDRDRRRSTVEAGFRSQLFHRPVGCIRSGLVYRSQRRTRCRERTCAVV